MKVYYITKNHNSIKAIEDYLEIIKSTFNKYDVIDSQFLIPNQINCIIDEATDQKFIIEIEKIKKEYPSTIIIYFFTEFITTFRNNGKQIDTFNYFEYSKKFENYVENQIYYNKGFKLLKIKKFIKIIFKYLYKLFKYLLYKLFVTIYKKNRYLNKFLKVIWENLLEKIFVLFKDFLINSTLFFLKLRGIIFHNLRSFYYKIFYNFKSFYDKIFNNFKSLYIKLYGKNQNFYFLKYMFSRYNGFLKISDFIDIFLITHPAQKNQINQVLQNKKNIFMCYSKIPEIKPMENIELNISGENTLYRSEILKKLIKLNVDPRNNFEKFMKSKFYLKKYFGWYSLNPPKNEKWPYSSPMRYILSIKNGEIPLILDNFSFDNYFSDLNLKKQIIDLQKLNYKKYLSDIKTINEKIRTFNLKNAKNVKEFLNLVNSLDRSFQK